jgi:hypothetical protein
VNGKRDKEKKKEKKKKEKEKRKKEEKKEEEKMKECSQVISGQMKLIIFFGNE